MLSRATQSFARLGSLSGASIRARALPNAPFRLSGTRSYQLYNQRRSPFGKKENVIYGILGTNLLVFAGWQMSDKDMNLRRFMMHHFTISSVRFFGHHYFHTLLTACFSHQEIWHLALNMFTLYSFGMSALMSLSVGRFLALYFGGGIVSSLCQLLWPYFIPRGWPARRLYSPDVIGLGASGAVNAVIAWSILTYPKQLIYLYGIVPLPAALFGLGFFALDAYSLYEGSGRVGNAAHLGGAAFGGLMFLVFRRFR